MKIDIELRARQFALVTLGAMVTDARGSVGGSTFSRNNAGAYVRARTKPVNPNTPAQSLVRANFGANSKSWSGNLSSSQNAAWTAFAQANPQVNRLGAQINLSGLAMYNKLNQVLTQIGSANISDPPPDLSVPALATVTGLAVTGATSIELNTAAQTVLAGAKYYIFATAPAAGGKKPASSAYRFIGAFAAVAAAVVIDLTADYAAVFGAIGATGTSVGVSAATVNTTTGAVTTPLIFNGIAS